MKLKTIYKKTNGGKIQEWTIEIEDNKFRTISGQTDGKKVISKWTEVEGKNIGRANATTASEQALKEAEAKRTKKLESGYYEDITQIEIPQYFKPMLARTFELDKATYPCYTQPKLDGIRCIITKDGAFSRNGKPFVTIPHILEELVPFLEMSTDAVLDGELYNHDFHDDFNQIVSLVKRTKPTEEDLKKSKKYVQYWIYDVPRIDGFTESDTFWNRINRLYDVLPSNLDSIKIVNTEAANNQKALDELYEEYMSNGFEGQMIRYNRPYENKRSKYLLKRKEFQDEEFTILGYEEGKGNRKGTIGYFCFENKDGKPFKSNVKGSFEYITKLWENRDSYIGKEATIKFFNYTPDGIPRFPYVIKIDRQSYE